MRWRAPGSTVVRQERFLDYGVRRCRLTLSNPRCKPLEPSVLKLKYDKPLSSFAFKFNLRRYNGVSELKLYATRMAALGAGAGTRPVSSST